MIERGDLDTRRGKGRQMTDFSYDEARLEQTKNLVQKVDNRNSDNEWACY